MNETNLRISQKTVLFEDYKLGVLQRILFCSAVAFFLSCPMMLSVLGRIVGFFLMLELLILCVWYYGANVKARKNHRTQERKTVSLDTLSHRIPVVWAIFFMFVVAMTAVGAVVNPHDTPHNVYDWFVLAGDYAAPLLLFPIPAVFNCLYASARDLTDSEEENEATRRRGNLGVVAAVVLAFLASYAMLFYAAPAISRYSSSYEETQKNVLYHDISAVTSYKNTNDVNGLFKALPLSDNLKCVTCYEGLLHVTYEGVEESEIKRLVLYNATAATALLDRVQTLRFTVNDENYNFTAEKVIALYDDFSGILKDTTWRSVVTAPLSDTDTVNERFESLFDAEEPTEEPVLLTILPDCKINEGNLILVNYENEYDGEQAETFTNLRDIFPTERFKYNDPAFLVPVAANALEAMFEDYDVNAKEGKTIRVNSAYRSAATQQDLYDRYLREEGQAYVDKYVAVAHYSEHQTGLGIDLTNSDYLAKNCYKFGFVRRYTEDKVSITHTANEKWHYRYVGILHATYMTENNLCLEEYIELLHTKTQDDPLMIDDVCVFHIPENGSVTVPVGTVVTFSGDNVDGYIVAMILPQDNE